MEGLKFENRDGMDICISTNEEIEEEIKRLEDIHFGPGGEFEEYACLRGVGMGEDFESEAVLSEEGMLEVKKIINKFVADTKDMSDDEKIKYLSDFIFESKKRKV
jgi:hypothetical protein